jgi:hypothetical protein
LARGLFLRDYQLEFWDDEEDIYNDCQVHDSDRGYVGHGTGQVYKDESPSSSSLPSRDGDVFAPRRPG